MQKKTYRILIPSLLLLLLTSDLFSQNETKSIITEKICHEWNFSHYLVSNAEKVSPKEQENDKFVLFRDGTVKAIASGDSSTGIWSYEMEKAVLNLTPAETQTTTEFRIEEVNEKLLIISTKGPDGNQMQIQLTR